MTGHPSPAPAGLVLAAALCFAASPLLVPDFGGFRADQFPVPQVDAPVKPAGYAFSIWGVIYVWLLVSAGFGLLARARAVDWHPMRAPLALSLGVGAAWLPVATISPVAATVLIWIMLVAALRALSVAPALERWLARGPVALYTGWLTAASCVSVGLLLGGYGIMDMRAAAVLALMLALGLSIAVLKRVRDIPEYGFAVTWALIAITVAGWEAAGLVTWLAATGAALVAGVTLAGVRQDA